MTSRLRLRKKKYNPPLQEPPDPQYVQCNKTTDKPEMTNKKISITQSNTNEEPKKTYIKSYAEIARSSTKINITKEPKKTTTNKCPQIDIYSTQIFDENEIFTKSIESAKKHNIKLKAGRKDRRYGNCASEAVINNINDRDCFSDKLLQSPNWYRRNWMSQMMEKLLDGRCPWNMGYTEQQIREGFAKLQESGIYEIDFFGDLMIGGIACGIRKRILIFNTSENLVHDPISVVDPEFYDVRIKIDNTTPVVVAYNNYHYENLHTIDEEDRQETMRLVDSYMKDRYKVDYGFTKEDTSNCTINTRQEKKIFHQEWANSNISNTIERKQ